ncbi:MAG: hypothetical protein WD023_02720 [Ilumatobacteraceae bacterium]
MTGPAFLAWNSPSDAMALTVANAAGNAPFLAVLRYNRARIASALTRPASTEATMLGRRRPL